MKKITITSQGFAGEVYIMYGQEGELLQLDFQSSQLTDQQKEWIKAYCPLKYSDDLPKHFNASQLLFSVEGYAVTFEMFWNRYDQKINRLRAEKLWAKLSDSDKLRAYSGFATYDRHLKLHTWKSKADPETYIKNRYWENEYK